METLANKNNNNNNNNNNPYYYHSLLKNISIVFLIIGALFFVFFSINSSNKSLISSSYSSRPLRCGHSSHHNKTTKQVIAKDELGEVLEKASMRNKTVIITVVNRAYVQGDVIPNMLDLFLEGLWEGEGTRELLNHLIVVAVDQTAYDRCRFRGLHCYGLVTDGVDYMGEKVYLSSEFINMMWRRTLFLQNVLQRGYNFIFTDTDVVWLRNPFTVLTTNTTQDLDIQFSTDSHDNGNSTTKVYPINTGFYFVKSNNKTVSLFEKWYDFKNKSNGAKEQDVLQYLIFHGAHTELGIKVRFLKTILFSGFCQDSSDIKSVVTVHANCCRFIKAKVADLVQVLRDWGSFKVKQGNLTSPFFWSPHLGCQRSWSKKGRG